jgi:hypothetical protein
MAAMQCAWQLACCSWRVGACRTTSCQRKTAWIAWQGLVAGNRPHRTLGTTAAHRDHLPLVRPLPSLRALRAVHDRCVRQRDCAGFWAWAGRQRRVVAAAGGDWA